MYFAVLQDGFTERLTQCLILLFFQEGSSGGSRSLPLENQFAVRCREHQLSRKEVCARPGGHRATGQDIVTMLFLSKHAEGRHGLPACMRPRALSKWLYDPKVLPKMDPAPPLLLRVHEAVCQWIVIPMKNSESQGCCGYQYFGVLSFLRILSSMFRMF